MLEGEDPNFPDVTDPDGWQLLSWHGYSLRCRDLYTRGFMRWVWCVRHAVVFRERGIGGPVGQSTVRWVWCCSSSVISSGAYPSSLGIASVCSPSAGIGPMGSSKCRQAVGGSTARTTPAGVLTSPARSAQMARGQWCSYCCLLNGDRRDAVKRQVVSWRGHGVEHGRSVDARPIPNGVAIDSQPGIIREAKRMGL